jgi:sensor c-di-GMP phosphodiesterase-like protein
MTSTLHNSKFRCITDTALMLHVLHTTGQMYTFAVSVMLYGRLCVPLTDLLEHCSSLPSTVPVVVSTPANKLQQQQQQQRHSQQSSTGSTASTASTQQQQQQQQQQPQLIAALPQALSEGLQQLVPMMPLLRRRGSNPGIQTPLAAAASSSTSGNSSSNHASNGTAAATAAAASSNGSSSGHKHHLHLHHSHHQQQQQHLSNSSGSASQHHSSSGGADAHSATASTAASAAAAASGTTAVWDMREERLAAAKAALCVAFEVLELMRRYRLDVEELVYRALIDACVR